MTGGPLRTSVVSTISLFCAALAAVSASPALAASPAVRAQLAPVAGGADWERTLTIDVPPLAWRTGEGGVHPEIEGFGRLGVIGAPDLPVRLERVAIDPGGGLRIVGVDADWDEGKIPGAIGVFPEDALDRPALDESQYGAGEWWPAEAARVATEDGAFRSLRFAEVEIAPVQVDVKAGRFRVARRIVVHLERTGASAGMRATQWSAPDALVDALAGDVALGAGEVGRAPVGGAAQKAAAGAGTLAAPTYPAWQIEVDKDGLYRLPYTWVMANLPGLTSRDPRQFRLTVQGVEVPILVEGESDGVFGPGDAIVFYGQAAVGDLFAPDVNPASPTEPGWEHGDFTDTNVYRLDLVASPARIAADPGTRAPAHGYTLSTSFRTTVHHERQDRFFGFFPRNGMTHWYMGSYLSAGCQDAATCTDVRPASFCKNACVSGQTCCGSSTEQTIDTPGSVGGSVTLRAYVVAMDTAADLHRSEVWVGGVLKDTADWQPWTDYTHSVALTGPLGATTTVKIRLPLGRTDGQGQYVDYDAANWDWAEIDYDRNYGVAADRLTFTSPNANGEIHLTGLSGSTRVWEITDATASRDGMAIALPKEVQGVQMVGSEARFEYDQNGGAATRQFVGAGPTGVLTPKAGRQDTPPSSLDPSLGDSLKGTNLGANWVVIANRSLLNTGGGSQFNAWVNRRKAQGLLTAVVDIRDIYDEFTDGIEDPQAIRDFISWTLSNWSPAPTYVTLVGDATRDYKNYYGYSPPRQFVPSYMIDKAADPQFEYYIADSWFGAVVGTDAIPDVLIGRIPAHSQAEAEAVFSKIVSYEQSAPPVGFSGHAMLVSENDAKYNFFAIHDNVYDRFFTSGPQTAEKVYEQDPAVVGCQPAADDEKARIKTAVNNGAAILSVVSHGGYKNWGSGCSFFNNEPPATHDDIDDLTNGSKLQFQVHGGCITGHFTQDNASGATEMQYTFLEDWLTTAGKGIVAGIAPSHLAYVFHVESVLDPVYDGIFGKHKERVVGQLDLKMRLNLASVNDLVSVRSYILMGDPATKLIVPAPAAPAITSVSKAGSGQLQVNWSSVAGVSRYRLYRSSYPTGGYQQVYDGGALTYLDAGMTNCTEYYYYAVAVDANGFESRWSNFNDTCYGDRSDCKYGTPENPSPPAQVTGVTVVDTQEGGRLRVSWSTANQAADVLRYRAFYGTTPGGPYPNQSETAAPSSNLMLGGLTNKTTYYVVVRAEHCTLNGPLSAQASGVPHLVQGISPPDSVGDLRVTKAASPSKNLNLDWTVPTQTVWGTPTTVTLVEVYGSQTSPIFALDVAHRLASLTTAPMNHFTHSNAQNGTNPWYYLVIASDAAGLRSAAGDETPDAVADLRLHGVDTNADGKPDQVTLNWTPVTRNLDGGATYVAGYNLYGRASVLPRAQCGPANLLAGALPAGGVTRALPTDALYTWQLLAQDAYGGESVW